MRINYNTNINHTLDHERRLMETLADKHGRQDARVLAQSEVLDKLIVDITRRQLNNAK